jgi:hypothetical protein
MILIRILLLEHPPTWSIGAWSRFLSCKNNQDLWRAEKTIEGYWVDELDLVLTKLGFQLRTQQIESREQTQD